MQYEDTIEVRGVTVMRQADGALLWRMGNQDRLIAATQLQPGSTVACEGQAVEQAWSPAKGSVTDQLVVGTGDRVTLPDVLMAGDVGLKYLVNDHYSPLRERMISLRGSRLVLLVILVAPLVMAGYVALTVLLFLPLLGLRRIFRRRSTPAVVRCDGDAPRYSGVANLWDAATRSA